MFVGEGAVLFGECIPGLGGFFQCLGLSRAAALFLDDEIGQ